MQIAFSMSVPAAADFALLVLPAGADGAPSKAVDWQQSLTLDGVEIAHRFEERAAGGPAIVFTAGPGRLDYRLRATIAGEQPTSQHIDEHDYLADSRYVEASQLVAFASERFGRGDGFTQLEAICAWVHRHFSYDPAMSAIDDSAISTLRKSGGMCRDYAHVTIALARALGIPARYVSVYAPALEPQDFHAVVEAWIDGAWWLFDATRLAPRGSMIRIASGRDAFDTAWASNERATVTLTSLVVDASDDSLAADAVDAPRMRVQLAGA